MMRAVFAACTALAIALGSTAAWAQTQQPAPSQGKLGQTALDFWIAGKDTSDSRKDADENTRLLPPSGPATPIPYCGPSAPVCP